MRKLTILILSFYCVIAKSQSDWELIYGSDSSLNIGNVFMTDTNLIWGTSGGSVLRSTDWGESWETLFSDADYRFWDIFFTDSLCGWILGKPFVLHTIDGGANWIQQSIPNPLGLDVEAIYFLDQDTGWIAGSYRMIFVTYDGGSNWMVQNGEVNYGHYFLYDIYFYDDMHGCAAGGGLISDVPLIMTTDDGGLTWTEIYPSTEGVIQKVQFTNEFVVWACDHEGRIFKSYDKGFTWEIIVDLFNIHPDDMFFFNEDQAIVGGSSHTYITTDGWNSSQSVELQLANAIHDFSLHEQSGIAIGTNNILKTPDGGLTWTRLNDRFNRIAWFDPMNGWLLPEYLNKNMLHTTDGGTTWNEVMLGQTGKLLEISFPTDITGYVITSENELLKTTNAGGTWQLIQLPFDSAYMRDMQFLDESTGFMCDYPNTLFKTLDGGYNWEILPVDTLSSMVALDFLTPLEGWVVGWDGVCGHTQDGGKTWNFVNIEVNYGMREINFINPEVGFITSMFNIFRTGNGGKDWLKLSPFLNQPQNIEFMDSLNGWVTDRVNVYRTYDGGFNWVDSLNFASDNWQDEITDLFLMDSTLVWICTLDGRVYKYSEFLEIKEGHETAAFTVYPNPANEIVYIRFELKSSGKVNLQLYNILGQPVNLIYQGYLSQGLQTISFSLEDLSEGIYFIRIDTEGEVRAKKIVIH